VTLEANALKRGFPWCSLRVAMDGTREVRHDRSTAGGQRGPRHGCKSRHRRSDG
jgi:hypothetical protein